jgi:hypothetical protein
MGCAAGPKLAPNDSITLLYDLKNEKSYAGSGTTLYDVTNQRNTTIYGPTYNAGGWLEFDGSGERDFDPPGDYIGIPTSASSTYPPTKTAGVTYQWWAYFEQNQPNGHGLFVGAGTINHLEWRNTYFRTEAVYVNGYSFGGGSPSIANDTWHHMTIVFANAETNRPVRWYLNGELYHTGNMGGSSNANEYFQPNKFGRSTGHPLYLYAESFYGGMSYMVMYDRSLTADEIKTNFNATRSRYGV